MRNGKRLRAGTALVLALAALLAGGCGKPTGRVSGSVTYNGKALPGGSIVFQAADGKRCQGRIQPDGTYTVLDAPVGPCKVAVQNNDLQKQAPGGMRGVPAQAAEQARKELAKKELGLSQNPFESGGQYVKLPDKYGNPEQSGLTATVGRGANEGVNFDLK